MGNAYVLFVLAVKQEPQSENNNNDRISGHVFYLSDRIQILRSFCAKTITGEEGGLKFSVLTNWIGRENKFKIL